MTGSANQFRRKRFAHFRDSLLRVIGEKGTAHVLDVGGTQAYWDSLAPLWWDLPVRFTIVNLEAQRQSLDRMEIIPGDACHMPEFHDNSFDIVHSNSVIEHVGRWPEMVAMAGEIRRLAPRYYVQTPNMWFPIEPHYKLPFLHWLPSQIQAHIFLMRKGRYVPRGADYSTAYELTERVELLTIRQMKLLFTDAEIIREKLMGLTKSIVAIRV